MNMFEGESQAAGSQHPVSVFRINECGQRRIFRCLSSNSRVALICRAVQLRSLPVALREKMVSWFLRPIEYHRLSNVA